MQNSTDGVGCGAAVPGTKQATELRGRTEMRRNPLDAPVKGRAWGGTRFGHTHVDLKKKPARCGLRFNVLPMLQSSHQPMLSARCSASGAQAICKVPPRCKSTNVSGITVPLKQAGHTGLHTLQPAQRSALKSSRTSTEGGV